MVDNIRSVGASNIILAPGSEQGQSESVLLTQGSKLLKGRSNLVFDLHAYEKWFREPQTSVEARIKKLQSLGFAPLFREVSPKNSSELMKPSPFLKAAQSTGTSVCAWLWKYDSNDPDAILRADKRSNDHNNNGWGSLYRSFISSKRLTRKWFGISC